MRVVKDPEVRKQEILDAAIQVFARKGYDKTSISDIAAEANMSQGLCYRYFPSKEDIYNEAVEQYATLIAQRNHNEYLKLVKKNNAVTLREQIKLLCENMSTYKNAEHEDKGLYEMFHRPDGKRLHMQLSFLIMEKVIPYMEEALAEAKKRGEISIDDTAATARFMMYGQLPLIFDRNISDEECGKKLEDITFRLLGLS